MKHVQIDQNGYYRYRRRVPKYAKTFVGKSGFVKVLGKTESETLGNYGDKNWGYSVRRQTYIWYEYGSVIH